MSDKEVVITFRENSEGSLVGFPFETDQYISLEEGNEVTIYLAHESDLTSSQEQSLDTNPAVVSYKIRDETL